MNEELTKEVLEAMTKCGLDCARCGSEFCNKYDWQDIVQTLAAALLEERAKPKVWDGAPDNAGRGIVNWFDKNGLFIDSSIYTRELPKTRARILAEEIVRGINDEIYSDTKDIEYVEGVLKRYAEELEEK